MYLYIYAWRGYVRGSSHYLPDVEYMVTAGGALSEYYLQGISRASVGYKQGISRASVGVSAHQPSIMNEKR